MRLAVLIGLFCCSWAQAQSLISDDDLATAAMLRDRALESPLGYELLESLTVEVGPRMAGTDGDRRGVEWAKAMFEKLGYDRVVAEPVTFPLWVRRAESAAITAPYPQPLAVTALGYSPGTPDGGIEAEVVQFATIDDLEGAEPGSLEGKIAFVANRMDRHKTGAGYGPAVAARRNGSKFAAERGALAVLIRSIGTDDNRTPHTGVMFRDEEGVFVPAAALSNPDADLLELALKRGSVSVRLNLDVGVEGEGQSYNVYGDITGTDLAEEVVVIGGHLDSWDLGTGAIDDGFGVATTMAAAKLIAEHAPQRPRRTIRVIAWANEEQGLWGARAYHAAHQAEMDHHVIGAESDFGGGPVWSFASRVDEERLDVIAQIQTVLEPLGIEPGNNEAFGGADLVPLRAAGMPVVSLYQDGTDYFDYHHTANDTLDKVDPMSMRQNVAAFVVFSYLAAQAPGSFRPAPE